VRAGIKESRVIEVRRSNLFLDEHVVTTGLLPPCALSSPLLVVYYSFSFALTIFILTVHIDPELIVLTRLVNAGAYVYIPGLPYPCEIYWCRNGEVIIIATGCMHGSYYYDLSGYIYIPPT
jgi:hypothetical protein